MLHQRRLSLLYRCLHSHGCGYGFLQVVVVGCTCPFHLNVYDQVGFVFLIIRVITSLGDVHTVALYLLVSFFR